MSIHGAMVQSSYGLELLLTSEKMSNGMNLAAFLSYQKTGE